jgi:glucan phosphoethanolaminetransferase (alkaline phosphatase superfamily)
MITERIRNDLLLMTAAALLAALLVIARAPFWPLYPLAVLSGALARVYGGRIAQLFLLLAASAVGPFAWRLAGARGAAEGVMVLEDAGVAGVIEYIREFVLVGLPRRAWLLLPCALLLGIVIGSLAMRHSARVAWIDSPRRRWLAITALAVLALAVATPRMRLRTWEARNAWATERRARDDDRRFATSIDAGLPSLDRTPLVGRNDLDVVLYIGESATRWNWRLYGYPRETNAGLASGVAPERLVVFTDAVTSHDTAAARWPASGLSLLPFLYRRSVSGVVPLAHTLGRAGIRTTWLGNPNKPWSYSDAITGGRPVAAHGVQYDGDLIPLLRSALSRAPSSGRLFVLDTYAGHFPWCRGIPSESVVHWDDWMGHLPDLAIWGSGIPYRTALDCYDSAMRYTSVTIDSAMRVVDRSVRPAILLYVANRGEDVWDQAGHYGESRTARETDVPLLVYGNAALAQRFPDLLANARQHRDARVASARLYEALLDLFGVAAADSSQTFDRRLSVFDAAYDSRADSVTPGSREPVDTVRHASNEGPSGGTLCAHRSNSLFKYLEGKAAYNCVELDVVLDSGSRGDGEAFVYHPPVANPGLPLYEMLERTGVPRLGLWLDVKNLTDRNLPPMLARLSALVPAELRGRVVVETSELTLSRSAAARALGDSGFVLSYYLPTDLGCECARSMGGECAREISRLRRAIDGGEFRSLSFDARGRQLARAVQDSVTPRPVLNAWTPMDRCANGDAPTPLTESARDSLLREVRKFLVRLPSVFTY